MLDEDSTMVVDDIVLVVLKKKIQEYDGKLLFSSNQINVFFREIKYLNFIRENNFQDSIFTKKLCNLLFLAQFNMKIVAI